MHIAYPAAGLTLHGRLNMINAQQIYDSGVLEQHMSVFNEGGGQSRLSVMEVSGGKA